MPTWDRADDASLIAKITFIRLNYYINSIIVARMSKTANPTPAAAGRAPSPPDRAAETRQRLLRAGLELFGQQGFEATSTRALAEHARTNLAAIPYHFGGKAGLYGAVAAFLVEEIRGRILANPALVAVLEAPPATPADARAVLHALLDRMIDVIVGGKEAELWAPFVLREQMTPSPAFDILYDGLMAHFIAVIQRCVALATGGSHDAEVTAIRAFTLFGQVMSFRAAQSAVRRALSWSAFGPRELGAIKTVVHLNIDAILDAGLET